MCKNSWTAKRFFRSLESSEKTLIASNNETIQAVISKIWPEDCYNYDVSGCSTKCLSITVRTQGTRKMKTKITLCIYANMAGKVKKPPLLIGIMKQPRCLKHFIYQKDKHCETFPLKRMTATIFIKCIQDWNSKSKLNIKMEKKDKDLMELFLVDEWTETETYTAKGVWLFTIIVDDTSTPKNYIAPTAFVMLAWVKYNYVISICKQLLPFIKPYQHLI